MCFPFMERFVTAHKALEGLPLNLNGFGFSFECGYGHGKCRDSVVVKWISVNEEVA